MSIYYGYGQNPVSGANEAEHQFSNSTSAEQVMATYIDFNTTDTVTSAITPAVGCLHWVDDDQTLNLGTGGAGSPELQIGQEQWLRVRNNTGTTLPNGCVVYVNGAQGQRPTVTSADYAGENDSSQTIGILTEEITNNGNGFCCTFGLVRGLDTQGLTEGAALYLGTSGTFTTTKPTSPNHEVRLGNVIFADATDGIIFTSVNNGWEFYELHDVDNLVDNARTLDGYYIKSDSGSGLWTSAVFNDDVASSPTMTDVIATSGNWDSVYSSVNSTSANWDSVYSTVNTNSANYALKDTDNNFSTDQTFQGDINASQVLNLASYTNSSPANGDIWNDGTKINIQAGLKVKRGNNPTSPALDILNDADLSVLRFYADSDGDGQFIALTSAGSTVYNLDSDANNGYHALLNGIQRFGSTTNASPTNGEIWYDGAGVNIQGTVKLQSRTLSATNYIDLEDSTGWGVRVDGSNDALRPLVDNDTELGLSSRRWSKVWATDGDFSGSVNVSQVLNLTSATNGSPVEGDLWYDGTNLKFRDSTTTRTISWT